MSLPTGSLLATVVAVPFLVASGYAIAVLAGPWSEDLLIAALAGAGVVALASVVGVLVMTPWATRPMSLWMTFWLGATVVRLLLTPLLAFVVYSATSLDSTSLILALAIAYFCTLMGEAAVIAASVRQALNRADADAGAVTTDASPTTVTN